MIESAVNSANLMNWPAKAKKVRFRKNGSGSDSILDRKYQQNSAIKKTPSKKPTELTIVVSYLSDRSKLLCSYGAGKGYVWIQGATFNSTVAGISHSRVISHCMLQTVAQRTGPGNENL